MLSRGSLRCSFRRAAGGGGETAGMQRQPPRPPAAPCPPGRTSLLVRSGLGRLEVTLRDDVPLQPSSKPGDHLARDGPGFVLVGLKPHEIKGLPYPKPHCFGDVVGI